MKIEEILQKATDSEKDQCLAHGYKLSDDFLGNETQGRVFMATATEERIANNPRLNLIAEMDPQVKVSIKIVNLDRGATQLTNDSKFVPSDIWFKNLFFGLPFITWLLDVFIGGKRVFLVNECVENGNLRLLLDMFDVERRDGGLSEVRVRGIFQRLAQAVFCIHERNVALRNLKPETIFLSGKLDLKIDDFTLANYVGDANPKTEILNSTYVGSPVCLAPEIILRIEIRDDLKTDCWSLGVILFIMVHGVPPFEGETISELEEVYDEEPSELDIQYRGDLSNHCKDLLENLLKFNPTDRLNVKEILNHPWLRHEPPDPKLNLPYLLSDMQRKAIRKHQGVEECYVEAYIAQRAALVNDMLMKIIRRSVVPDALLCEFGLSIAVQQDGRVEVWRLREFRDGLHPPQSAYKNFYRYLLPDFGMNLGIDALSDVTFIEGTSKLDTVMRVIKKAPLLEDWLKIKKGVLSPRNDDEKWVRLCNTVQLQPLPTPALAPPISEMPMIGYETTEPRNISLSPSLVDTPNPSFGVGALAGTVGSQLVKKRSTAEVINSEVERIFQCLRKKKHPAPGVTVDIGFNLEPSVKPSRVIPDEVADNGANEVAEKPKKKLPKKKPFWQMTKEEKLEEQRRTLPRCALYTPRGVVKEEKKKPAPDPKPMKIFDTVEEREAERRRTLPKCAFYTPRGMESPDNKGKKGNESERKEGKEPEQGEELSYGHPKFVIKAMKAPKIPVRMLTKKDSPRPQIAFGYKVPTPRSERKTPRGEKKEASPRSDAKKVTSSTSLPEASSNGELASKVRGKMSDTKLVDTRAGVVKKATTPKAIKSSGQLFRKQIAGDAGKKELPTSKRDSVVEQVPQKGNDSNGKAKVTKAKEVLTPSGSTPAADVLPVATSDELASEQPSKARRAKKSEEIKQSVKKSVDALKEKPVAAKIKPTKNGRSSDTKKCDSPSRKGAKSDSVAASRAFLRSAKRKLELVPDPPKCDDLNTSTKCDDSSILPSEKQTPKRKQIKRRIDGSKVEDKPDKLNVAEKEPKHDTEQVTIVTKQVTSGVVFGKSDHAASGVNSPNTIATAKKSRKHKRKQPYLRKKKTKETTPDAVDQNQPRPNRIAKDQPTPTGKAVGETTKTVDDTTDGTVEDISTSVTVPQKMIAISEKDMKQSDVKDVFNLEAILKNPDSPTSPEGEELPVLPDESMPAKIVENKASEGSLLADDGTKNVLPTSSNGEELAASSNECMPDSPSDHKDLSTEIEEKGAMNDNLPADDSTQNLNPNIAEKKAFTKSVNLGSTKPDGNKSENATALNTKDQKSWKTKSGMKLIKRRASTLRITKDISMEEILKHFDSPTSSEEELPVLSDDSMPDSLFDGKNAFNLEEILKRFDSPPSCEGDELPTFTDDSMPECSSDRKDVLNQIEEKGASKGSLPAVDGTENVDGNLTSVTVSEQMIGISKEVVEKVDVKEVFNLEAFLKQHGSPTSCDGEELLASSDESIPAKIVENKASEGSLQADDGTQNDPPTSSEGEELPVFTDDSMPDSPSDGKVLSTEIEEKMPSKDNLPADDGAENLNPNVIEKKGSSKSVNQKGSKPDGNEVKNATDTTALNTKDDKGSNKNSKEELAKTHGSTSRFVNRKVTEMEIQKFSETDLKEYAEFRRANRERNNVAIQKSLDTVPVFGNKIEKYLAPVEQRNTSILDVGSTNTIIAVAAKEPESAAARWLEFTAVIEPAATAVKVPEAGIGQLPSINSLQLATDSVDKSNHDDDSPTSQKQEGLINAVVSNKKTSSFGQIPVKRSSLEVVDDDMKVPEQVENVSCDKQVLHAGSTTLLECEVLDFVAASDQSNIEQPDQVPNKLSSADLTAEPEPHPKVPPRKSKKTKKSLDENSLKLAHYLDIKQPLTPMNVIAPQPDNGNGGCTKSLTDLKDIPFLTVNDVLKVPKKEKDFSRFENRQFTNEDLHQMPDDELNDYLQYKKILVQKKREGREARLKAMYKESLANDVRLQRYISVKVLPENDLPSSPKVSDIESAKEALDSLSSKSYGKDEPSLRAGSQKSSIHQLQPCSSSLAKEDFEKGSIASHTSNSVVSKSDLDLQTDQVILTFPEENENSDNYPSSDKGDKLSPNDFPSSTTPKSAGIEPDTDKENGATNKVVLDPIWNVIEASDLPNGSPQAHSLDIIQQLASESLMEEYAADEQTDIKSSTVSSVLFSTDNSLDEFDQSESDVDEQKGKANLSGASIADEENGVQPKNVVTKPIEIVTLFSNFDQLSSEAQSDDQVHLDFCASPLLPRQQINATNTDDQLSECSSPRPLDLQLLPSEHVMAIDKVDNWINDVAAATTDESDNGSEGTEDLMLDLSTFIKKNGNPSSDDNSIVSGLTPKHQNRDEEGSAVNIGRKSRSRVKNKRDSYRRSGNGSSASGSPDSRRGRREVVNKESTKKKSSFRVSLPIDVESDAVETSFCDSSSDSSLDFDLGSLRKARSLQKCSSSGISINSHTKYKSVSRSKKSDISKGKEKNLISDSEESVQSSVKRDRHLSGSENSDRSKASAEKCLRACKKSVEGIAKQTKYMDGSKKPVNSRSITSKYTIGSEKSVDSRVKPSKYMNGFEKSVDSRIMPSKYMNGSEKSDESRVKPRKYMNGSEKSDNSRVKPSKYMNGSERSDDTRVKPRKYMNASEKSDDSRAKPSKYMNGSDKSVDSRVKPSKYMNGSEKSDDSRVKPSKYMNGSEKSDDSRVKPSKYMNGSEKSVDSRVKPRKYMNGSEKSDDSRVKPRKYMNGSEKSDESRVKPRKYMNGSEKSDDSRVKPSKYMNGSEKSVDSRVKPSKYMNGSEKSDDSRVKPSKYMNGSEKSVDSRVKPRKYMNGSEKSDDSRVKPRKYMNGSEKSDESRVKPRKYMNGSEKSDNSRVKPSKYMNGSDKSVDSRVKPSKYMNGSEKSDDSRVKPRKYMNGSEKSDNSRVKPSKYMNGSDKSVDSRVKPSKCINGSEKSVDSKVKPRKYMNGSEKLVKSRTSEEKCTRRSDRSVDKQAKHKKYFSESEKSFVIESREARYDSQSERSLQVKEEKYFSRSDMSARSQTKLDKSLRKSGRSIQSSRSPSQQDSCRENRQPKIEKQGKKKKSCATPDTEQRIFGFSFPTSKQSKKRKQIVQELPDSDSSPASSEDFIIDDARTDESGDTYSMETLSEASCESMQSVASLPKRVRDKRAIKEEPMMSRAQMQHMYEIEMHKIAIERHQHRIEIEKRSIEIEKCNIKMREHSMELEKLKANEYRPMKHESESFTVSHQCHSQPRRRHNVKSKRAIHVDGRSKGAM